MIKRVQSLWIGDELSNIEVLCIKSFLAHGHDFDLFVYGDITGIPDGTTIHDANEILPESSLFLVNGSPAIFADWFRWKLLYKRGGFWVDMDTVCLRPFEFNDKYVFGKEEFDRANNAVLGFPADDEFCKTMMDTCENPKIINPFDPPGLVKRKKKCARLFRKKDPNTYLNWGEIGGPWGFTNALNYFNLLELAKPFVTFYPIHPQNWNAIFLPDIFPDLDIETEVFPYTYAIHIWHEYFRRHNIDKNARYETGCLIDRLMKRYM